MDIVFRSRRLEQAFNEERVLRAKHGVKQARKIRSRMAVLQAAKNLGDFWPPYAKPERCHELKGDRAGQLSMDLDHPYRLVFKPAHNPLPRRPDGGLDWFQITAVEILSVEDIHD